LLFFLGYLSWDVFGESDSLYLYQEPLVEYSALILTILSVIGLSYWSQSLVEGFIAGASLSSTFWIGFLFRTIEIFRAPKWGLPNKIAVLRIYGVGALSSILAFSFMGLFFGLLGRIYDSLFLEKKIEEVFVFRDYWSNVYSLGKNNRREVKDLDQKLVFRVPGSLDLHNWWLRISQNITEVKPELIFNRVIKKTGIEEANVFGTGDVYDVSSGKKIRENLVDPVSLLSSFRPSIMNMPSLSHSLGGGRRLAFEELITRFLGWFIGSRFLLALFLGLSFVTSGFIMRYYAVYENIDFIAVITSQDIVWWEYDFMNVVYILGSCITASGLILFFITRWRSLSSKLYEKRPDERTMIFTVYLCFILSYWMSYQFITQPPYIIQGGDFAGSWIVWALWFLFLSLLLGVSYIFIHRESEVSNIYLYDGSEQVGEFDLNLKSYRNNDDAPFWLKEECELYWVLRYMYYWPIELTLIPHSDWERIEVWVDAFTGKVKWVVSDYHYRELWYSVEDSLQNNHKAGFLLNFHTPIPFVKTEDVQVINHAVNQASSRLMRMVVTGRSGVRDILFKQGELDWKEIHDSDWIKSYGLMGPAADFCSNLKWSYWRYPWGIDDVERYSMNPATHPNDQPKQIGE